MNVQFNLFLLCKCILGNSLECLLDVNSLLCRGFKVWNIALGLAPSHCALLGYLSLVLLNINLVAQYNKREGFWVTRRSLNEELIPPAIEGFE